MKRLLLTLIWSAISAKQVFAALPAATDPQLVTVPELPGGFFLSATSYYLQPTVSNGDLDYALSRDTPPNATVSDITNTLKSINFQYNNWGVGVTLGYVFPKSGTDLSLNYFTLDAEESDAFTRFIFPLPTPPITFFPSLATPVSGVNLLDYFNNFELLGEGYTGILGADSKANLDIDQVDAVAGQTLDIGCRFILHPMTGLRWGYINRKLYTNAAAQFQGPPSSPEKISGSEKVTESSRFSGIGPIAGFDASYYLGLGFGLIAHATSGLLVGDIDASTDVQAQIARANDMGDILLANSIEASADLDKKYRIAPFYDAKLALDYTLMVNPHRNSHLSIEAGWHINQYFNAVDRLVTIVNVASKPITMDPVVTETVKHQTADLALNGPYVTLTYHA